MRFTLVIFLLTLPTIKSNAQLAHRGFYDFIFESNITKDTTIFYPKDGLSQAFRFIGTLKIEGMSYQCISTFYNYDGRGVTYLVFYNDIDEKRYQIDYSEELPIAVEMDCLVFSSYKICNFSFNVDLCFPNGTCYLPE